MDKIDWDSGTLSSQIAISAMIIWRWTGYNALIYLAAMQAVPQSLHEAAILDGASSLQRLRKITIPMIRPTIIFTVIISTIGGMQVLAEPLRLRRRRRSPAVRTGSSRPSRSTCTRWASAGTTSATPRRPPG